MQKCRNSPSRFSSWPRRAAQGASNLGSPSEAAATRANQGEGASSSADRGSAVRFSVSWLEAPKVPKPPKVSLLALSDAALDELGALDGLVVHFPMLNVSLNLR
jgi:hypothetical protein